MGRKEMGNIEIKNNQAMMRTVSQMQKLGKGKRKYIMRLQKYNVKILAVLVKELKKQFTIYETNPQLKGAIVFIDYLQIELNAKKTEIKVSFDEVGFLRNTIKEQLKSMETIEFKWYNFIKKLQVKMLNVQYREVLKDINS